MSTQDCKKAFFLSEGYSGDVPDMELAWLKGQTLQPFNSVNQQWKWFLEQQGMSGEVSEMQLNWWRSLGAPADGDWPDCRDWFWCENGGYYPGPQGALLLEAGDNLLLESGDLLLLEET